MIGRFRQEETEDVVELKGFDDFEVRLGDVMRGERATLGKSLLDVQRELKIKATYIAAIENSDPSAFETPGFIAGYVRSYARYLDLDPEWAYRAFCAESNFETAHGMSAAASTKQIETSRRARAVGHDPFAGSAMGFVPKGSGFFSGIEPGAIGSSIVLLGLIGLIGYGGYAVLTEVQRVQFVPVEQTPDVVADLDPLTSAQPVTPQAPEVVAAQTERLDRIYRPDPLDVPVLTARDGPISTLDPRSIGAFAGFEPVEPPAQLTAENTPRGGSPNPFDFVVAPVNPDDTPDRAVQVIADNNPDVVMFAVRDSWVRVRSADGTTLYEQIMKEGDQFVLPQTEEPATLRTGESGAIYFAVNGVHYGPAGATGQITSNLALSAENLTSSYQIADLAQDAALARVVVELEQTTLPVPPTGNPRAAD